MLYLKETLAVLLRKKGGGGGEEEVAYAMGGKTNTSTAAVDERRQLNRLSAGSELDISSIFSAYVNSTFTTSYWLRLHATQSRLWGPNFRLLNP